MRINDQIFGPSKRRVPVGVSAVCIGLVLATGCTSPDGRPNNTATGALAGGLAGGLVGAFAGGSRHGGRNAFIGAAAGVVTGAVIGHIMDERQRQRLREQSPQTLAAIQHNDYVLQQQYAAPPPSAAAQPSFAPQPAFAPQPSAAPPPSAAPQPATAPPPEATAPTSAPAQNQGLIPLSVDDVKALASAGVKADVIIKEIENSKAVYSPQDVAAAQQANPPVDPSVIDCMKNHSRSQ
jgi:hypothetical protein